MLLVATAYEAEEWHDISKMGKEDIEEWEKVGVDDGVEGSVFDSGRGLRRDCMAAMFKPLSTS